MKRILLFATGLMLSGLLASCEKDPERGADGGGKPIEIEASCTFEGLTSQQVRPRAIGVYGNAADWSAVENYIVNKKFYNAKYLPGSAGVYQGELKWSGGGVSHRLMAYAPYSTGFDFTNVSKLGGVLPRVQDCDLLSPWDGAAELNFMYGAADGLTATSRVSIAMQPAFSILKFEFENAVGDPIEMLSLDMRSDNAQDVLTCGYSIHLGVPTPQVAILEPGKSPAAGLLFTNGEVAVGGTAEAYLVVNPSDLTGRTLALTVETEDGDYKTTIAGMDLQSGVCTSVPVSITNLVLEPPVAETVTVADGGTTNKAYLGKTVTITGTGISKIESLTLGDVTVTPTTLTATELVFKIPESFTFNTATDCDLVATFKGTRLATLATLKVYPFYYHKNVQVSGRGVMSTVFFLPNTGEVISSDAWKDVDILASSTTQSSGNTLNKTVVTTAADYYSVPPYFGLATAAAGGMNFLSPSNSAAQLANYRLADGKTLMTTSGTWGTPIICFKNLDVSNATYANTVKDGTLAGIDLATLNQYVTTGYPAYIGTGTPTTAQFTGGSVILVQYVNYTHGKLASLAADGVNRCGFLVVKSITEMNTSTPPLPTINSVMTFDMYWSKEINR